MTRIFKKKNLIIFIISLFILAGLLQIPLNMEYFAINKLIIRNNLIVPTSRVRNTCNYLAGKNIFQFSNNALKENIKKIPQVRKVKTNLILPNTVAITIYERKPWINLIVEKKNIIIDKSGIILNTPLTNEINTAMLPIVKAKFGNPQEGEHIDFTLLSMLKSVVPSLQDLFKPEQLQINLSDMNDIKIRADDILLIKIGNTKFIKQKRAILKTFLSHIKNHWKEVEYINIKSIKNPVIKYKSYE